jgi:putative transposase
MHYGVAMNNYGSIVPKLGRIRDTKTLSQTAKTRLKWMDFYESHDRNARLTCRHFGISPDVFYRWKRRYKPGYLASLEGFSRRPKQVRRPETDPVIVARIKELRELYPRWGKKKLHAMLVDEGRSISQATVGRTLSRLRAAGRLNEPAIVTARLAGKRRQSLRKRPHARKRDWAFVPKQPGDLVQLDTLRVRTESNDTRYQFTAQDYVSKFTARSVATKITSSAATVILDALEDRLPVKVKAIQVDGGSEFMAVFERLCQLRGIELYVLPPRSPKLNGLVERMNRTSREEIYDLALHELTSIDEHNDLLRQQDYIYNHIRPHEALGLKAPARYHESIKT